MTRPLQPGDQIAKYRIIGPLGSGGMGEVYLAQDLTLERNVALKILPLELVQSEDRVRRFIQEARSASSLNHPNIVTIYEIGHDVIRPSGSDAPKDENRIHFISMELVVGRTLGMLIHEERTDLRTLLGYLAQAAEGLAKAHGAGIVHRDLKPGNIMVSSDGFTKVLDFGLAKLIEHRDPDPSVTNAPTMARDVTLEGRIMGTVGYMAPEQVQGKPVDHRADVFALGCILYEAATRRRPFEAESSVEVMHKILHDHPLPVETLNAAVPAELRRLIRRALAKNPEKRLQSMKDLAIELREIVEEYDSLPASTTSTTRYPSEVVAGSRPRPVLKRSWGLVGLAAVIAISAAIWGLRKDGGTEATAATPFRVTSLTSRGDVNECVISRDGRYLGYLTSITGISSIHVLQVATGSDVEVSSTRDAQIEGLSFSPDGNFLWYLTRKKDAPNYRSLLQVPSLGGSSRERVFDVDSRVGFSPDGKRIVFKRGEPQENRDVLTVHDLETGNEQRVLTVSHPRFLNAVAWSPDGRRLAAVDWGPSPNGITSRVILVPLTGGGEEVLSEHRGSRLESIDWLPDGSAVVLSGPDVALSVTSQLQFVSVPRGQRTPLTNDVSEYEGVSVAADGSIAATRQLRLGDIWVANIEGGELRQVLSVSNPDRAPFEVVCVDSQEVHYAAKSEDEIHLFSVPITGGEPRLLTPPGGMIIWLGGYRGGILLDRVDAKELISHIWKIDADGTNLRQITHGTGENIVDLTWDGRTFLYTRTDTTGYWLASTEGGEPRLVGGDPRYRYGGLLSPDGRTLVAYELVQEGNLMRPRIHVFSVPDGREMFAFKGAPNVHMPRFADDLGSFYFVDRTDPGWNIFRGHFQNQDVVPVTRFTEGRIQQYAASPDGKHIALVLRTEGGENVWVTGPDGSDPRQITQFTSKDVLRLVWNPDGRRVVIYAGQAGRDAVILKRPERT